jgi:hypothetical protein
MTSHFENTISGLKTFTSWIGHHDKKRVYLLNDNTGCEPDSSYNLSSKGSNLCLLNKLGFNVPSAFILSPKSSLDYMENKKFIPSELIQETFEALKQVENESMKLFGASGTVIKHKSKYSS